jgi:hypothetical protein
MKRQTKPGCCSCGAKCTLDCVDNFGQPYKGCPNCRILSLGEIEAIMRAGQHKSEGREG